jgi:hypothetical protein
VPKLQTEREENIAAIAAVFHSDERYDDFYKKNANAFSGFTGIWQFMVKAAKAFTKAETTFSDRQDVWGNHDWIDAIDTYVDELFNLSAPADEDAKSLYKLAKKAILES